MEIPNEHLKDVCKINTAEACKYLTCGTNGFGCAKLTSFKKVIDINTCNMNAKGDNCDGIK